MNNKTKKYLLLNLHVYYVQYNGYGFTPNFIHLAVLCFDQAEKQTECQPPGHRRPDQ